MATAKKRDPAKWARAKAKAKAKMGGKHSARAMQLAVKYYKDMGGTYSGKKSSKNKLSKWSKQKWDYVSKGDKKKPKKKKEIRMVCWRAHVFSEALGAKNRLSERDQIQYEN